MSPRDGVIRDKLVERLATLDVDGRDLSIEVVRGQVVVKGSVPSEDQRRRVQDGFAGAHAIEITVR